MKVASDRGYTGEKELGGGGGGGVILWIMH